MMYTLKGSYAVLMLLLFTRTYGDLFRHAEQPQQYNPNDTVDTIPSLPWYLTSTQEIVLHDILHDILKSIIPQSFDIKAIQKRPLDASFYSGPIAATYSSDGVLSQGNVYRLLNGHWMLCENGCVDCEPCATQGNPLFKWILQSVNQSSNSDPLRHDFQLTIISKTNNPFHTNNFWPNNSNHVISETDRSSILVTKTKQDNDSENSLPNHENSFSQPNHRSKDLLTERDLISQEKNHLQGNASTDKPLEQKHRLRNMKYRLRPVEKTAEEANQLAPKLILGTDQRGQKHLIHVVPADHPPINTSHFANLLAPNHSISSHFVAGQASRLNNTISKHEKQTYQRIFRRVFNSLNTHRQSIESFLKSPNNVSEQRIASSIDNMDVAGFPWHNRDINHTNANFESFRLNETLLLPFYATNNDEIEKNQQHRYNHGYQYVNPHVNNYYGHANRNQTKISRGQIQLPINFDFDREWRKALVRQYYINNKNISRINSSILLQSSDNSSIDAIPKPGFNNNFVINSTKQIDPNETFIDKANNDFIKSSSIIIKRENERAFDSERLPSGDANREFETLRHAFRIITTDSPVIQRGHEILNRTTAL